jgi:anti-anti-sigma factor
MRQSNGFSITKDILMQGNADTATWNIPGPEIMDTDKYLSSTNAPDLEEDVRLCIASGAREMILNCEALSYMTGAGVRAFLNIARMMNEADGSLRIKGLTGQPREIFTACGIDALIPSVDKIENIASIQARLDLSNLSR